MEAEAIRQPRIAFDQRARAGKDRAQRRHAKRQQRSRVTDVHASIARDQRRMRRPARHGVNVGEIPTDRNFGNGARRAARALDCVLVGARRYGCHTVRSAENGRLQPLGKRTRPSTFRVDPTVATAANAQSPGADPRILVVEHEWHAKAAFHHRSDDRRIRRVYGDEHGVERTRTMQPPRGTS
jgi:hypothetical protein